MGWTNPMIGTLRNCRAQVRGSRKKGAESQQRKMQVDKADRVGEGVIAADAEEYLLPITADREK